MWFSALRDLRGPLYPVYLALAGCLCVCSVESYLGLGFEMGGVISSMGIIFGVYTLNRLTDTREDFTNDIGRLLFYQHRRGTFFFLGGVALAGSFAWLVWAGKLNWLHWLILGIGLGYSFQSIPLRGRGPLRWTRIKELLLVKNLSVAFLWGLSIFLVPINYAGGKGIDKLAVWLLASGLIVCTLNSTLFNDIVDEPGDRVAGIKTVPTVWGPARSIGILLTVDALWCVSALWLSIANRLGAGHLSMLLALGLYPLIYLLPTMSALRAGDASWPPKWLAALLSEIYLIGFAAGMFLLSPR